MEINYEKISSTVVSNHMKLNKAYGRLTGIGKPIIKYSADHPEILPANVHDICNYLARYGMANCQIQTVFKLDGTLNFEKLLKAVRISIEAEPVLGCRFIESDTPYWRRIENMDETLLCSFEETGCSDEAVKRFLESPLNIDTDPMVKVKLIRSGPLDTLCVKTNHICCDGTGTKEYIQLLAEIYTALDQENGCFSKTPRIASKKDQESLQDALVKNSQKIKWPPQQEPPSTLWAFPWKYPRTDDTSFSVCRLPLGQLGVMSRFAKARGATINDLILTAYYRAMFKFSKPPYGIPMDISSTIDLRQYLPDGKADAIRNFSNGFFTRIARVKNEPFERTLSRVVKVTKKIKSKCPGLESAFGVEIIENMHFLLTFNFFKILEHITEFMRQFPTVTGNLGLPGLSNLGFISKDLIRFGSSTATDAYILPPVLRTPGFFLVAGSYNGELTLTTSYYKDAILRKDVERLLAMVKDELVQGCM